jgi:[ribosomal protein S5]-alanine N-acetyltransferase
MTVPMADVRIDDPGPLRLRRPLVADIPGILAVHSDPQVYSLDPAERHPDAEYTAEWLRPMIEHWDRFGFGYWTVLVPADWIPGGVPGPAAGDDGLVIAGMGGLRRHQPVSGPVVLNVYYRFAPAAQGRGLARALVDAAIRWADVHARSEDLVVRTRPANAAARRVGERAGFVFEGPEPDDPTMVQLRLPAAARR